jgi:hypothetical protein
LFSIITSGLLLVCGIFNYDDIFESECGTGDVACTEAMYTFGVMSFQFL